MTTVSSQRIYSWAFETGFHGPVSAQTVGEAAMQFRQNGGAVVWLLDASNATDISPDAIEAMKQQVVELLPLNLTRIAIVVPMLARLYIPMIQESIPIPLVSFDTRNEAVRWIMRGCK